MEESFNDETMDNNGNEDVDVVKENENLFDEDGRIIIAKNKEDVMEMDKLFTTWATSPEIVINNLFAFLASIAMDNIKQSSTASFFELFPMIVDKFDESIITSKMDSFYVKQIFYSPIFGESKDVVRTWPAEFLSFINDKRIAMPSKNWLSKNVKVKNLPDTALQKKHYFGYQLWTIADKVKREITNKLNKLFIPKSKLKSGETPSALMDAIRFMMRNVFAIETARTRVKSKLTKLKFIARSNSGLTEEEKQIEVDKVVTEFNMEDEIKQKTEIIYQGLTHNWFPDCWISYFALSVPAYERCIPSFQTNAKEVLIYIHVSV